MDNKIYVGDVGLVILIDMGENITTATNCKLDVIAPKSRVKTDGTVTGGKTWTPTIVNSNFLQYSTQAGDLDQVGVYKINPKLTIGNWTGHGDTVEFTVLNKGK